jgi:uncharacterized protein (TIGR02118 family)
MMKLTILYDPPADPEAFEKYYAEHHVSEFVRSGRLPGLVRFEAGKGLPRRGEPPVYYRIADLFWDSAESMQSDLQSPAGQEGLRDVQSFANGGYKVMLSAVEVIDLAVGGHSVETPARA